MYIILSVLSFIIQLFSDKNLNILAKKLAYLLVSILKIRKKIVFKNLDIAFVGITTENKKEIMQESAYHFICTVLEFMKSKNGSLANNVKVIGKEHFTKALSQGKGAYALCCHLGNWEAMISAGAKHITEVHAVVKSVGSPGVDKFCQQKRKENGFNEIRKSKKIGAAIREIKKTLKENKAIGFMIDQSRSKEPRLPFFSMPAKTNTTLAALWHKDPIAVIPVFIVRERFNHHKLHILEPLQLKRSKDKQQDIIDNTITFNQTIEKIVSTHPEQYFWFHNRWK